MLKQIFMVRTISIDTSLSFDPTVTSFIQSFIDNGYSLHSTCVHGLFNKKITLVFCRYFEITKDVADAQEEKEPAEVQDVKEEPAVAPDGDTGWAAEVTKHTPKRTSRSNRKRTA